MRHTLKAIFDHRSDARHILNEFLASGYSRANTTLSSVRSAAPAGRYTAHSEEANIFRGSIKQFVAKLFGGSLQKRSGPVGIEDHDDEPNCDNVGAGLPCAATDDGENRPAYPPGTEPGALQNRAHEDSHYFGTQRADAPPTGNTFQETMGASSQWGHPNDGRLQIPALVSSVNLSGVSHDADPPSYRYGVEMRSSDQYRNRSWDEAEPGLKRGWGRLASDTPTWDASKAAIRRGWDEVTPEIDDDSYYRNHWTTRYANSDGDGDYDYYEPADIYASEARRSEKYRSRHWRDVESRLKAERAARHAGRMSSWDNFKDAVKHGSHGIGPDMDGKDFRPPGA